MTVMQLKEIPEMLDRWPMTKGNYRVMPMGDMMVGLTTTPPFDCTEAYKEGGLPGGVCPCPHYGYVFKGRIRSRYPGSDWPDEVAEAGMVYFFPAGHILIYEEETEALELNPTHALYMCMDAMQRYADRAPQKLEVTKNAYKTQAGYRESTGE